MPGFIKYLFFLLCTSLAAQESAFMYPDTSGLFPGKGPVKLMHSRLAEPGLSDAIIGGLTFLHQCQVQDEEYHVSPRDFRSHQGEKTGFFHYLRCSLSNHLIHEKHLPGSWPGFVSFIPSRGSRLVQPLFTATDYNLFITASTAMCLKYFDESELGAESRFVENMKTGALDAVEKFRRGTAYNFWLPQTSRRYQYLHTRPMNIPVGLISFRKQVNDLTGWWGLPGFRESQLLTDWIRMTHDRELNPHGAVALFNIPDDSDDSSLALILRLMNQPGALPDPGILDAILAYRDLDRNRTDRYNVSLGPGTGAFLTWHKNEELPVFSRPEEGVIPLEVNNVDLVVNANVLLALSLSGRSDEQGYTSTATLLARAIKEQLWKEGNIYYPEKLCFPYALSRAIREARGTITTLDTVIPVLVHDLINEQQVFEQLHPGLCGVFPPCDSVSTVMATALGLNTLLNLGELQARKAGLEHEFRSLISRSVQFLLTQQEQNRTMFRKPKDPPVSWPSGPLFSSSIHELAYWYSDALTTGLVVEALSKYALEYDRTPVSEEPGKLHLGKKGGRLFLE